MFYESERILTKNRKYLNIRAYGVIRELEQKGLTVAEQIASVDILLEDKTTEFQIDVLNKAKAILEATEKQNDTTEEIPNDSWDSNHTRFSNDSKYRHCLFIPLSGEV